VLTEAVTKYFPGADGDVVRAETCLFTNTADEHFVIGFLPGLPNVLMAGGCSGHAFKFCSVIGEVVGDLAMHGTSAFDLTLFDPARTRP
jgi:sarcosine oxidase